MSKFRIGDEVLIISPPDGNGQLVGLIGVVYGIDTVTLGNLTVGVHFKTPIYDYCDSWWCEEESLQLLEGEN